MSSYLTPTDIADDLGVSVNTVYQWFFKGLGPERIKLGKHVRVRRDAYERWLESRTIKGGK